MKITRAQALIRSLEQEKVKFISAILGAILRYMILSITLNKTYPYLFCLGAHELGDRPASR